MKNRFSYRLENRFVMKLYIFYFQNDNIKIKTNMKNRFSYRLENQFVKRLYIFYILIYNIKNQNQYEKQIFISS